MKEISSETISEIRKSGDFDKAEALISAALSSLSLPSAERFKFENQLLWCKQGRIKNVIKEIEEGKKRSQDTSSLLQLLHVSVREIYSLTNGFTNRLIARRVLLDVTKVSEQIDWYSNFAFTVMDKSRLLEDSTFWEPNHFNGGIYKPDVYTVSRALAKDLDERSPNATVRVRQLIAIFERMIPNLTEDIKVWAEGDLLTLYRKAGEKELEYSMLKKLLEKKSSEFWMWRHAYNYFKDVGELETAISCLAKGISCYGDDGFKVKLLKDLVVELIAAEKYDLAAQFGTRLYKTYEKNGWPLAKDTKELISRWQVETLSVDMKLQDSFIKSTSRLAESLLYVSTKKLHCTYVDEMIIKTPARKKIKWRLSYQENGMYKSRLISSRRDLKVASGVELVLELGLTNSGSEFILDVSLGDDTFWSHCKSGLGLIVGSNNSGHLYIELEPLTEPIRTSKKCETREFNVGDTVEYRLIQGKEKPEVCLLLKTDEQYEYRKVVSGNLKITGNGSHGFVDDVFLPSRLLVNQAAGDFVNVIARKSWDQKKSKESWEAVSVFS